AAAFTQPPGDGGGSGCTGGVALHQGQARGSLRGRRLTSPPVDQGHAPWSRFTGLRRERRPASVTLAVPLSLVFQAMAPKNPATNVKTALRVIEIIEIFAREGKPLSLTELSRQLGAPVSSCLNLLRTLTGLGYLYETAPRQGYYPTGRLLAMAQRIARADPILEKIGPTLAALRDAVAETVVLAKLAPDAEVVYLEVFPSPHPIS